MKHKLLATVLILITFSIIGVVLLSHANQYVPPAIPSNATYTPLDYTGNFYKLSDPDYRSPHIFIHRDPTDHYKPTKKPFEASKERTQPFDIKQVIRDTPWYTATVTYKDQTTWIKYRRFLPPITVDHGYTWEEETTRHSPIGTKLSKIHIIKHPTTVERFYSTKLKRKSPDKKMDNRAIFKHYGVENIEQFIAHLAKKHADPSWQRDVILGEIQMGSKTLIVQCMSSETEKGYRIIAPAYIHTGGHYLFDEYAMWDDDLYVELSGRNYHLVTGLTEMREGHYAP